MTHVRKRTLFPPGTVPLNVSPDTGGSKLGFSLPKSFVDSVQVHLLGTEGLLFCQASKQLYYLNTTAAYIWCAFLEGSETRGIANDIAAQFGITPERALQDINETLSKWTNTELPTPASAQEPTTRGAQGIDTDVQFLGAESHLYRLGTQHFHIRYNSESTAARVHPTLAHLETRPTTIENATPVDIEFVAGHYELRVHGKIHAQGLIEEEITPLIHRIMLSNAFESSNCLAAFHAGVIANSQGCLMLPGLPGSGKSTLVAALVENGYRYLTDELTLLMSDSTLRPLPISLGLKRGSWPLFPTALRDQTVNRQPDGTEVRYLPTTTLQQHCPPLQALVFPRYTANAQTQLTMLSPARALYELSIAGYAVKQELNSELVSELAAWITPLSCYQLEVGELSSAVSTVRNLLP